MKIDRIFFLQIAPKLALMISRMSWICQESSSYIEELSRKREKMSPLTVKIEFKRK